MADEINVSAVSFGEAFAPTRRYQCPFFQRRYAWTNKNLEPFVDDLFSLLDDDTDEHYLGAIVLRRDQDAVQGALRPDVWQVIDGQQRLTTAFLTILALAELMHDAARHGPNEVAARKAVGIVEQYLTLPEGWDASLEPKVFPTAGDFSQFRAVLADASRLTTNRALAEFPFRFNQEFVPAYGEGTGRLTKAHTKLRSLLRDGLGEAASDPAAIEALLDVFTRKMKIIEVLVPDTADPYEIFNNLNTQGERLKHHELVKVSVFKRFALNEADAARDLSDGPWAKLTESLKEDGFEKFLFPYALCKNPAAQKKNLTAALEALWSDTRPTVVVEDMQRFAEPFLLLTDPGTAIDGIADGQLAERIRSLRASKPPASVLPYLMQVLLRASSDASYAESAARIFWETEAFLIRRLVDGIEPTGLHALFKQLWDWTSSDGKSSGQMPGGLAAALSVSQTIKTVDDDVFEAQLKSGPIYKRRIASFLVAEYERAHKGDINDDALTTSLTIEHVAPQEPQGTAWITAFTDADEYERLVHTWGNLVPLVKSGDAGNSAAGQAPWADKRTIYSTSTFQTAKSAATFDTWDPATIASRAEQATKWARVRWSAASPSKLPTCPKDIPAGN
jgi:hypothetical protein